MAAKSVTHTVSLSLGNISLSLSDTQNSAANPTNIALGDQTIGTGSPEYLGRTNQGDALADVEMSGHKVMLLLRNDTDTGGGDLLVSLANDTNYRISLKPQFTNLLTITNLQDVKVLSSSGSVTFTYMAVQIDE